MGEVHVNMNVTLDGVIQANGGPSDADAGYEFAGWERPYWDDEGGEQVIADAQSADALLLGRTTYEIFAPYWPTQSGGVADVFNRVPKYVASRGTPDLSWETTTQVRDAATEVRELRDRHEQVHTWGSGNLLQTLLAEGLVDQVNLWTHPVVLGTGKRIFPEGVTPTRFEAVEAPRAFPAGVVLQRLRRLDGPPETA